MVFLVLFTFYSMIAGYLFLSIYAGWLANRRGRSGIGYFVLSMVASPFAGIVVVLIAGHNEAGPVKKRSLQGPDSTQIPGQPASADKSVTAPGSSASSADGNLGMPIAAPVDRRSGESLPPRTER